MKTSDTEATVYIHGVHCPTCRGFGYTNETATEIRKGRNGVYTHRQGSGCPDCGGTGKIDVDHELRKLMARSPANATAYRVSA